MSREIVSGMIAVLDFDIFQAIKIKHFWEVYVDLVGLIDTVEFSKWLEPFSFSVG